MNDLFPDLQQQLNKLSIRKMQFQVTQIEFDFDDSFEVENYDQDVIDEVLATTWEVHDEEDLLDEISACTGWCIKSIDYRNILTNAIGGWA
jgi:hypothetical protein